MIFRNEIEICNFTTGVNVLIFESRFFNEISNSIDCCVLNSNLQLGSLDELKYLNINVSKST